MARSIALTALVVLALFDNAFAQSGNTLQGRVALPNGVQPANPVKITLTFNGMRLFETFSDLSGRFSFTALRSGNYILTAEGDGQTFETTSVTAEVSAMGRAPLTFTQNIVLRPMKGKPLPTAGAVSVDSADPSIPPKAREIGRAHV